MYIIRNALKSISRSISRNILIGIIVTVIAFAACIGLSIRQAAESAKESTLEGLSVTAQISMDMKTMMGDMKSGEDGGFDKDNFKDKINSMSGLELEELELYATADSVENFYYTATLSLNGSDSFEAVSNATDTDSDTAQTGKTDMPDMGDRGGMSFGSASDFTVIGYSSDEAMTGFINGTSSIEEGNCFEEQTESYDCIISTELAAYNDITVGDTVTVTNPNNEEEAYTLTVVGTYNNTDAGGDAVSGMFRGSFGATDPTNQIYMSATAVQSIAAQSETSASADSDEESTALSTAISGTYVFETVEDYEKFEEQARDLGLSEDYTVSSYDLNSYEQSLVPLESLSNIAKYFLIIVLAIGAIILVVFNLFNIRERKYEVGVLTAIGMKKSKVAMQFLCEVLVITFISVIIGGAAGAVSSVPVTNALLESQVSSQEANTQQIAQSFGRGGMEMPDGEAPDGEAPGGDIPSGGGPGGMGAMFKDFGNRATEYITEVNSATNLTVLLQLLALALLLTLVASAVSVVFIMRYDPLKILANRD